MGIQEEIDQFFSGIKNDYFDFQRKFEREIIIRVFSPIKLQEKNSLKDNYNEKINMRAQGTKKAMLKIAEQLDTTIQGKFSISVKKSLETKSNEYNLENFS